MRGRRSAHLVLIRLQQRLLSSVEAFARTLDLHARHVAERTGDPRTGDSRTATLPLEVAVADDEDADADVHGLDDDEIEARDASRVAAVSRRLPTPPEKARRLLAEMQELAGRFRAAPGAKARAILDWIGRHQCADGIDAGTAERLERAEALGGRRDVVRDELESGRHLRALERQIAAAGRILNRSREALGFRPELLRRTLDEALALAGAGALVKAGDGTFRLPELPASWDATVDTLRPRRERDEPFWDWRRRAPLPLVFEPPKRLREDRVHLHLAHPLVQRLLGRFLAQGFSASDLERVTVVRDPDDARVHAVAFGRLSLFGPGATRLHDRLVSVAAPIFEGEDGDGDDSNVEPLDEATEQRLVDRMWRLFEDPPAVDDVSPAVRRRLVDAVAPTFRALWPHLREEADSLAHQAEDQLAARGRKEAADLRKLLEVQRRAIEKEVQRQLTFDFTDAERDQRRQWENDRQHMAERLEQLESEIGSEPPEL